MSLKITQILNEIILTEEEVSVFTDYVPVYTLNTPTKVKFKLSTAGEGELEGTIQLSESEHEKLLQGKPLNYYTFEIVIDDEKRTIQLSGKEVNKEGTPSLYKNFPYNFIFGDDIIKGDEEDNFYNGPDLDDVNKELYDLKSESETFKVISKYKNDEEFQRVLLDSFISGTKSIKMNQKSITDTLKDLRKNGLLEEPEMSGRKRNYLKLKLSLQKFINNLFKLFAKLHKNGKNSNTYNIIKKFYKQLFFIVTKGQSNISDQKTRDKLWKQLLGNFSDLLKGLSNSKDFVKGKSKNKQNENFILEEVRKEQIIFTEFNFTDEQIESSFEEVHDKYEGDLDALERYGFMLYGKDAGKLFPKLSFKYRDLKNLIRLGRGDISGRMEKRQDKYNIRDITTTDNKTMTNLPKFLLEFLENVKWKDNEGNEIRIPKGSIVPFNWDKDKKQLIHKQSGKKYSNVSQIIIGMSTEPKIGEEYSNEKISEVIPLSGKVIETSPNVRVKFKIIPEEK